MSLPNHDHECWVDEGWARVHVGLHDWRLYKRKKGIEVWYCAVCRRVEERGDDGR